MKRFCDLHTHSTFSDGTVPPAGLVEKAIQRGISALALTDHNTAAGLPEFMEAGKERGLLTVPGCEFTTDYEGVELHIVGLGFAKEVWQEIEDYVELMHIAKRQSNLKLIERLQAAGYQVTYAEAQALTDGGAFNRAHVARVLVGKGQLSSVQEGFKTILKEGNGFYVPPKRLSALATIRFIKMYGAKAVLAHPFLNLDEEALREFLPQAIEAGLDAMETRYSTYSEETTVLSESIAKEFGLKQSGGSDYHGDAKPGLELGIGYGDLEVPYEFYENLFLEDGNES